MWLYSFVQKLGTLNKMSDNVKVQELEDEITKTFIYFHLKYF